MQSELVARFIWLFFASKLTQKYQMYCFLKRIDIASSTDAIGWFGLLFHAKTIMEQCQQVSFDDILVDWIRRDKDINPYGTFRDIQCTMYTRGTGAQCEKPSR